MTAERHARKGDKKEANYSTTRTKYAVIKKKLFKMVKKLLPLKLMALLS